MNYQYGLVAYNQWVSSLSVADPRRVPWADLAPSDQELWHGISHAVIRASAANVPHFVTGTDARPSDVSDRPGIPADPELHAADPMARNLIHQLQDRIDQLEKRVLVLESQRHTHYPRTPEPIPYQGTSGAGDATGVAQ